MGRNVIKVSLSTQGVNRALKELAAYKADVLRKIDLLMISLADQGAEILRHKIVQMNAVMFGDLLSSVDGVYANGVAVIKMGTDHAMFVEFGVGTVAQSSPYPGELPAGWVYDKNKRTVTLKDGTVIPGWWYWGDWDNNWHFTQGMPSRPVMYLTAKEMPDLVQHLTKTVFG